MSNTVYDLGGNIMMLDPKTKVDPGVYLPDAENCK